MWKARWPVLHARSLLPPTSTRPLPLGVLAQPTLKQPEQGPSPRQRPTLQATPTVESLSLVQALILQAERLSAAHMQLLPWSCGPSLDSPQSYVLVLGAMGASQEGRQNLLGTSAARQGPCPCDKTQKAHAEKPKKKSIIGI